MRNDAASGTDRRAAARVLQDFWEEMGAGLDPAFARALKKAEAEARRAQTGARSPAGRAVADPVAEAQRMAASAHTLPDLFAAIAAYPHSPLKAGSRNTVTHDGPLDAPVMVIGEGPGREEDERGQPFIGPAGQLLDRMLAAIGLSRQENVFITNVNYWRPPRNADPSPEVIAQCRPFFTRMIALQRPRLIIAAGKVPAQALLRCEEGIMKLRGQAFTLSINELSLPFHPVFHPAFLLRQPRMKALAWRDLLAIEARLRALNVLA